MIVTPNDSKEFLAAPNASEQSETADDHAITGGSDLYAKNNDAERRAVPV